MIRTGEQYLQALRDGRRVFCDGEFIDDVTTHPKTRGYARAMASYYDLHHDPEHLDVTTFIDEDGERRAMHWFLPRSKEDIVRRRHYYELVWKHLQGAMYKRPPCSMLPVFYTMVDDPDPWEQNSKFHDGRPLAKYIRDQWKSLRDNDLSFSPMFLDVQYDRSRDDALAETPMLRMVDRNDKGIVVRGWKAIGTGMPFVDELLIGNLWKPGQTPDQTVYALVPANSEGLTIYVRASNAVDESRAYDRPMASQGDELDGMAYFDDVFIPWERVQHLGNPEHAKWYPQRTFDWIHVETQIRHCTNAELIAGLGLLVTNALGTQNHPAVQANMADLIRFRETCRAFTIAAEETGFHTPGGLYKPNNIFVDFGRAYYLENIGRMTEILIDFCGRGVVLYPTEADLKDPYMGPKLEEAFRGPGISPHDRTKLFNLIHERYLSEWGSRNEMFEKFNGTPLFLIRILTMQRTEYQVDGPLTELARDVLNFGGMDEIAARAAKAEKESHYASVRYQPEYAREQDQQQGYYAEDEAGKAPDSAAAPRAGTK